MYRDMLSESRRMARGDLWDEIRAWAAAHPNAALALAVCAALGPFLAKPFNMDDPLFIWTAHQIQAHPFNPFGFDVNWYKAASPMWSVTENPPLAGYYMALAAGILGWSEIALHLAFLLPALGVILGTHRLARRFCDRPLPAALVVLCAPVFLVSSATVMCDVLMLAFWVWAVEFWMEGVERNCLWRLLAAGLLIALAALTKYFGVCLIPLLGVHAWMSRRGFGKWMAGLLIPLLALCAWDWAARALYQHSLLWQAAGYSSRMRDWDSGAKAAVVEVVEVGAADPAEAHADANVALPERRYGRLFDADVFGGVSDDGAHGDYLGSDDGNSERETREMGFEIALRVSTAPFD